MIAQAVVAGARIGEVSCPTRYEKDSSSINLRRSIRYGLGVLQTCADYRLTRSGLRRSDYLDFTPEQSIQLPDHRRVPEPGQAGSAAENAAKNAQSN
jgi:hypothetical protein